MFGTGRDATPAGEPGRLKPTDLRGGHHAAQIHVLAGAFCDATPTRVTGDVHHRRENPVDADGRGLFGGDTRRLRDEVRIPRTRQRERDGENRAEAVDDVATDDQGDAEPGAGHRLALERVDHGGLVDVED